jgi:hypothetical protein
MATATTPNVGNDDDAGSDAGASSDDTGSPADDSASTADANGDPGTDPGGGGPSCTETCTHGVCLPSGGCACDPNWGGAHCDQDSSMLTPGTPMAGAVTAGQWVYYSFTGDATGLTVDLEETQTTGLVWGYLSAGYTPDLTQYLSSNQDAASASHTMTYAFESQGHQTWYVAVYGQPAIPSDAQPIPYNVTLSVIP